MDWKTVEEEEPPPDTKLLFMSDKGRFFVGDMCYGMHRPWFCTHPPVEDWDTVVLNDNHNITHWCLIESPS